MYERSLLSLLSLFSSHNAHADLTHPSPRDPDGYSSGSIGCPLDWLHPWLTHVPRRPPPESQLGPHHPTMHQGPSAGNSKAAMTLHVGPAACSCARARCTLVAIVVLPPT